jgi:hypothetical protein
MKAKFTKQILVYGFMFLAVFAGCKKSKEEAPIQNTNPISSILANLQFKWDLNYFTTMDSTQNSILKDTILADDGDYFDFKTDMKCHINLSSILNINSYVVVNDSLLKLNGDSLFILSFNQSSLVLKKRAFIDTLYTQNVFYLSK